MKTAAKVFIIFGMIFGAITIFPIILGIFAIRALNRAKSHSDLTSWGVATLFFVSFLGGILLLCVKDEDLLDNKKANDLQQLNEVVHDELDNETEIQYSNPTNYTVTNRNSIDDVFITAVLFDEL